MILSSMQIWRDRFRPRLKQASLFSEAGEGLSPYSIGTHRHTSEIEQELGVVAGTAVTVTLPASGTDGAWRALHLLRRLNGATADDLHARLEETYGDEPFVHVTKKA